MKLGDLANCAVEKSCFTNAQPDFLTIPFISTPAKFKCITGEHATESYFSVENLIESHPK